jgi:hypothetical protein
MTGDRAVVATQALLGIGCCPRPASWGLAAIQAAGSTISLPSWIRSRRRGRRLAASGRPIAFGRASSLFLALAFKPRLRIRLCPKATLNPAVAAGKGDFHRESAGIIRDDLVIGHTPNMARPSSSQCWVVSQFGPQTGVAPIGEWSPYWRHGAILGVSAAWTVSPSASVCTPSIAMAQHWTQVNTDPRDDLLSFPDRPPFFIGGWPGSDWNGGRHQIGSLAAIKS